MKEIVELVYVETSVVSGMFDENDHPIKTAPFWLAVENGRFRVLLSDVLEAEINKAPAVVQAFYKKISGQQVTRVYSTAESDALADKYIAEGVVSDSSLNDCKHVALAAIAGADVLVSWNCKHIVKLNKIRKYNAINRLLGYREIEIRTPYEVTNDEP